MARKIGILGSGMVAKALGNGFLKNGDSVMLSSRTPEKLAEWKAEAGEKAHTGTFAEAAGFGEILVLAVKGLIATQVLEMSGPTNLDGKIIIDATNPRGTESPENGVLKFFTNLDESLMERLQKAVPSAHFVKAFNSVGSAHMINPSFKEGRPSMFICGNNDQARKRVSEILDDFGWDVEDMGKAEAARAIEPLCILWCIPGFRNNQWNHAFKLLKG